jgi:uncharacterized RmlC-like cupin family protein
MTLLKPQIAIGALGLAAFTLTLTAQTVDPRVKVDNDRVRILNAVDRPHNKGALHKHDVNRVMIYLTPGDLDIVYQDGRTDHQHWKANDIAWSPAGALHTSENVGSGELQIVEIELKKPGPAAKVMRDPKLDPLAIDPAHNKLVFENDQVRVFRGTLEAGGKEKWHEHLGAGRATVMLTSFDGRLESADGKITPVRGVRGDVLWSDGSAKHRGANAGSQPVNLVLVEVK